MSISIKNADLALSPSGILWLDIQNTQNSGLEQAEQNIKTLFDDNYLKGLLYMGLGKNFDETASAGFIFWQKFAQHFIAAVCHTPDLSLVDGNFEVPAPSEDDLENVILQAPFMKGSEYITPELLIKFWQGLHEVLKNELKQHAGSFRALLSAHNGSWNLVGCVHFHLAENKNNPEMPFAFLATYTTRLTADHTVKHLPLGRALEEYAGEKNKSRLLALLTPVQKAAAQSVFIKNLVDSGDIFQPLAWTAHQAHLFLKDSALFEAAGIVVRVPNWWQATKPPRPQVSVSIGERKTITMGFDTMLDFKVNLTLRDGQTLTPEEWQEIITTQETLIKVKGQWVEVDHEQLRDVLAHWKKIEYQVKKNGLSFAEGVRLISGSAFNKTQNDEIAPEYTAQWSTINAGAWLKKTLQDLRNPESSHTEQIESIIKTYLHATLRPYQKTGVQWLWLLYRLKLGGCLADDMGLGKTIQVISLLLLIKYQQEKNQKRPHLLVVPASLLGNWQAEIKRFAPTLNVFFVHPSMRTGKLYYTDKHFEAYDLIITTYSFVHRAFYLSEVEWDIIFLDEAQVIKNPNTQQTREVKALKGSVRFILTGTPLENRLSDLWSLFDFFAPGLLGSLKEFGSYGSKKNKSVADEKKQFNFYAAVRSLIGPYILRRLKTDKRIITDLPDKTEISAYCSLTKTQIALYEQAVKELKAGLEATDGIQRRGLIFNFLMRFKQICNHPSQWLGYGDYKAIESGKFVRIAEICQDIAAKQEKVLIFTQFQEIIPALHDYVSTIFNREGLILHGGTPIKKRAELVKAFEHEQGPPFFVLSLKAGGTGLNLTNASHVIHFDRWWNPAVENQATDRAFRIGQKKNVLVYKFICRGTIEEKIDELIASKKSLSAEVLESGNEVLLTELSDEQLMNIVSLDIHRACEE